MTQEKEQLIDRLFKENVISLKEVLILSEKEVVEPNQPIYVNPVYVPFQRTEPLPNPYNPYTVTC